MMDLCIYIVAVLNRDERIHFVKHDVGVWLQDFSCLSWPNSYALIRQA